MSQYTSYENPLIARYASARMSELWSPQRKFSTWRRLWVALAEAEAELGLAVTPEQIAELKRHVDDQRYEEILKQLEYQAGQAELWRDAVARWFQRESGIPDEQARVGQYPGRVEAESMKLTGYEVKDVTPWEDASGSKAVACAAARCEATFTYTDAPAWRTINVRYFDQNNGVSHFRVFLGAQLIDEWAADDNLPTRKIDSTSSSLRVIHGIALRPGDEIRIEGVPDGAEPAALDYVEIR